MNIHNDYDMRKERMDEEKSCCISVICFVIKRLCISYRRASRG
jgi:hypothetical protein